MRFVVTNAGDRAAMQVVVSLTVRGAGPASVERLSIDQVPAGSEATGAFLLPEGASAAEATLAVEGYLEP